MDLPQKMTKNKKKLLQNKNEERRSDLSTHIHQHDGKTFVLLGIVY